METTESICPFCQVASIAEWEKQPIMLPDGSLPFEVHVTRCKNPKCRKPRIDLHELGENGSSHRKLINVTGAGSARRAPDVVRNENYEVARDFDEAALVLELSPRASAALSRRCLEHVIRSKTTLKSGDLNGLIKEMQSQLPMFLQDRLDHVRLLGNAAAHPLGELSIVDVEPDEAEWSLDTLVLLFEHLYLLPAKAKSMDDKLKAKKLAAKKVP